MTTITFIKPCTRVSIHVFGVLVCVDFLLDGNHDRAAAIK